MSKKGYITTSIVLLMILLLIIAVVLFARVCQFYGDEVIFQIGVGEVDESGAPKWSGESFLFTVEGKGNGSYRWYLASVFSSLELENTSDLPKDAEIVKIRIRRESKEKEICFAYDFYLKKVYAFIGNGWYVLSDTEEIDSILLSLLEKEYTLSHRGWLGQSTYCLDMPAEDLDYENQTFRYHLRWSLSHKLAEDASYEYRDSGFLNKSPSRLQSKEDAIQQAAKEMGYDQWIGVAFFDETCGYWMVEICDTNGEIFSSVQDANAYLFNHVYTVIMDESGITLKTYKHVTNFTPLYEKLTEETNHN